MFPVFFPWFLFKYMEGDDSKPYIPKCPSCGKVENKVESCAWCTHVYVKPKKHKKWSFERIVDDVIMLNFFTFISFVGILVYALATILAWIMGNADYNHHKPTLVEVVVSQWTWIVNTTKWFATLRIW